MYITILYNISNKYLYDIIIFIINYIKLINYKKINESFFVLKKILKKTMNKP